MTIEQACKKAIATDCLLRPKKMPARVIGGNDAWLESYHYTARDGKQIYFFRSPDNKDITWTPSFGDILDDWETKAR